MLDMEQGTDQWLELRKIKITGTDAATILGCSPYSTPYKLMQEKLGLSEPKAMNFAMQKGILMEEELRRTYSKSSGIEFLPSIELHGEFLMASLDGLSFDRKKILEIKTCNKKIFAEFKESKIPHHWYAQIQHQMATVPYANCVHLFCENAGNTFSQIVPRDEEYIKNLLIKEEDFYRLLLKKELPPMSAEDAEKQIVEINDEPKLEALLKKLMAMTVLRKGLEDEEADIKKQVLEYTDDGSCRAYGVLIKKSYVQRIDYKKACEDSKTDLARYEKAPQVRWTFTKEKEGEKD